MERMTWLTRAIAGASLFVLLTACSESPKTEVKKEPEKPAEPVTGRRAFQMMYLSARGWVPDAQPLQVQSYNLPQVKSEDGKAGAWQATFVSPSQSKSRLYTWSAVEAEGNLHKGVFASPEQSWSPGREQLPFDFTALRTDTDDVYKIAMERKDTIAFTTKNPGQPITFILQKTPRFPDLTWRMMWGTSASTSEYSVFVDASTGKFLEELH